MTNPVRLEDLQGVSDPKVVLPIIKQLAEGGEAIPSIQSVISVIGTRNTCRFSPKELEQARAYLMCGAYTHLTRSLHESERTSDELGIARQYLDALGHVDYLLPAERKIMLG